MEDADKLSKEKTSLTYDPLKFSFPEGTTTMACAYLPWLFHLYICSFTADFWKDKWQNWKDSLTSGKTDNTTAYFLFASEADYQSKLSRILTERILLWNLSDVK